MEQARAYRFPIVTKIIHPIASLDYATPAPRPANSVLDCRKLKAELVGIAPHRWTDGVARTLAQLRSAQE